MTRRPQTAPAGRHRRAAAAPGGARGRRAGPRRREPRPARPARGVPDLGLIWVDGGYANVVDTGLLGWAAGEEQVELVVVPRHADVRGFQVLPDAGWWN